MMTGRAQKIDRIELELYDNNLVADKAVFVVLDGGAYLYVGDGKTTYPNMRIHVSHAPLVTVDR